MDMKVWVNCYNEGLYDKRCLLNHLITRQKVTDDIIDSAITSKLLYLVKYEMKTNCVSDYIAYRKVKGTRLYKNLKNKKTKLYLKSVSFVIDLYNREMKSKREKMVLDLQLVLIQEMAKTWNKSYVEISDYLKKYDLLSYIDVCFEKYNSTGIQGILEDLQEYIEEQGGQVINDTCFNSIAVIKKIEKENEILIEYVKEVKHCTIEKAIQHYIKTSVYAMLQDEKTQLYTKTEKELKAMLWKELKGERYV